MGKFMHGHSGNPARRRKRLTAGSQKSSWATCTGRTETGKNQRSPKILVRSQPAAISEGASELSITLAFWLGASRTPCPWSCKRRFTRTGDEPGYDDAIQAVSRLHSVDYVLLLAACGEKAQESARQAPDTGADAVKESVAEIKQAGGEAAEAAKEVASMAGIRVKKGYEAVKQSAGEIAHVFSETVAAGADKAQEGAKKVADSAGVAVQNTISEGQAGIPAAMT